MTPTPEYGEASDASAELQAVLGARRQLGPDYDRVFVEKFVDRAEAELRARTAEPTPAPPTPGSGRTRSPATADVGVGGFSLAVATLSWGLLSTFLAVVAGATGNPFLGVVVVFGWGTLGLCDLVYFSLALDRARRRRT